MWKLLEQKSLRLQKADWEKSPCCEEGTAEQFHQTEYSGRNRKGIITDTHYYRSFQRLWEKKQQQVWCDHYGRGRHIRKWHYMWCFGCPFGTWTFFRWDGKSSEGDSLTPGMEVSVPRQRIPPGGTGMVPLNRKVSLPLNSLCQGTRRQQRGDLGWLNPVTSGDRQGHVRNPVLPCPVVKANGKL